METILQVFARLENAMGRALRGSRKHVGRRGKGRCRRATLECLEQRALLSISAAADRPPSLWTSGAEPVWLDFNPAEDSPPDTVAGLEITLASAKTVEGRVVLAGAWLEDGLLDGQSFARLSVPGCETTEEIGRPALPVLRRLLVLPEGAEPVVTISGQPHVVALTGIGKKIPKGTVPFSSNENWDSPRNENWDSPQVVSQPIPDHPLMPVQPPVPKVAGALEEAPLSFDAVAYQTDAFSSQPAARVIDVGYLAGQRLAMLEIAPVSYNPVAGELLVYDTLVFDVDFGTAQAAVGVVTAQQRDALAGLAVNYAPPPGDAAPPPGGRLLVIAHNTLAASPSLQDFVTLKTNQGWTVDLFNTTQAGTTTAAIKGFVGTRYANLATRPDALLLVGDVAQIPQFTGVGDDNPSTDLYYACMDAGDDWVPEFPVGRFSVTNTTQLTDVVQKTIAYETTSTGGVAPQGRLHGQRGQLFDQRRDPQRRDRYVHDAAGLHERQALLPYPAPPRSKSATP